MQSYPNYPTEDIRTDLRENTDGGVPFEGDDTQIEFSGNYYQSQNSVTQAAISGKIDGGAGISVKSERDIDRLPDDAEVRTSYNGNGISIIFNLIDGDDSDVWRDTRVRKAFAYIIDLDEVANQFYGIYGEHNTQYSGLVPTLENKLFDDEYVNSLEDYEQDFEKAEMLLRDAGLTFNGDWWVKPDGSELNPRFMAPTSVQFYVSGFQVAVSDLKSFGINAELNAVEGTSFFSQVIPNLNYGLTRGYYSHSEVPLAWRNSWVRYGGPSDETYSAYLQEPYDSTVVEVPPIGEPNSDERIEIDVLDRYNQIQHATETDEIRRISKELSWAFNQTVPRLPVSPAPSQWYLNHDGWQYPDKESPLGKPVNGLVWMLTQFGGIVPEE
jgi:ABC-type transport system substrate-binding protein